MMRKRLLLAVLCGLLVAPAALGQAGADPFADFTRDWRDDPVWYDGKAECAVYDATRTIYGQVRHYQARIYTDKELADPQTKTKSATREGRLVFKQHVRDDIATENYDYHYSTMVFVGADDLKSLKIDMGSQEDCGACFKQYINHAGTLTWLQCTYFPSEGRRDGRYTPPAGFAYDDALGVILRGYPFEQPRDVPVMLLADQTTTHLTPSEPSPATVHFVGRESLSLPVVGDVDTYHLSVGDEQFWFAADAKTLRHIMVQYEGPEGQTYRLKHVERRAYWVRGGK